MEMFDASDEVYEFLLCSICPVKLSKAGLCYNSKTNCIEDRIRDWIVEMPDQGFLFPVFNDRSTDLHSVLYYSKIPLWNRRILWIRCLAAHSPYLLRDSRISSTPLWKTPWEIPATMRRSKIFMSI